MDPSHLIPADWLATLHSWAPYVLGALAITTIAAHTLLPLARRVEEWARSTPATWDDGLAARAVIALEYAALASQALLAALPRLAVGDTKRKDGAK